MANEIHPRSNGVRCLLELGESVWRPEDIFGYLDIRLDIQDRRPKLVLACATKSSGWVSNVLLISQGTSVFTTPEYQ